MRREVRDDIADLIKPNELEEALAMARASCHHQVLHPLPGRHAQTETHAEYSSESSIAFALQDAHRAEQRSSRSAHANAGHGYEEVKVTFEKTFTSKDSRGGKGIPLVCIGTSEHAVYVMR